MIFWILLFPYLTAALLAAKKKNFNFVLACCLGCSLNIAFWHGTKALAENVAVTDTEYWNGYITRAAYFEEWDERVSCRHPIYRTESYECGSGNSPMTCTRSVYVGDEHSYDVDTHPEHWEAEDSIGTAYSISQTYFESLCKQFKNRSFQDMNRDYHSIDGDSYVTNYNNEWADMVPTSVEKKYENRVAASNSIFNYKKVDPLKLKLYEYPENQEGFVYHSVLSFARLPDQEQIDKINAYWGSSKKIRIWVLVYQNRPIQTAFDQEALWKNGNKNELVLCFSIDNAKDRNIQWCKVFSWSKSEELKSEINSNFTNKPLDFMELTRYLNVAVPEKWEKRDWKDFDYLPIDLPMWFYVLNVFLFIGGYVGTLFGGAAWEANSRPRSSPWR